ncbi:hypothetical protein [Sphingopyxis sp. JAI108]|uniref:hypothetical protein n=1 Tax=Sphingopyxis sp. JAI108 TaxID=2723060 RepID=UPI0015CD02E2|nr:hypothetical protein [Sphingopyxis sp. JAI108]NYF33672.1 hypothetical protein [Sphingopyxis sp. JAI108]
MSQSIATPARAADPSRLVVLLCALAQIGAALLPALGIGTPVGDRSDTVRTLITSAGWAFSIWGALYLGSLVFALLQFTAAGRGSSLFAALRWPAAGAFLGNALWATWVQLGAIDAVSTIIIFASLASILTAYRRIVDWTGGFTAAERWGAVLPLSALAAWLTAAAIVNVAASLRYYGVDAGPDSAPLISAAVVVIGGVLAAAALARGKGNPPFALVFLWALAAIYAAGGQQSVLVAGATAIAALLVLVGASFGWRDGGARHWPGRTRA